MKYLNKIYEINFISYSILKLNGELQRSILNVLFTKSQKIKRTGLYKVHLMTEDSHILYP